ncbi:MAG: nicotinate-nucleotide adenylyltransferase [Sphingobacteriales bacterium]|nr:nicotinate-nucleotide adenylyltransferase [Sphingobacteriales bacterium]
MTIGLYFGSFNPIHLGHLIIANHVADFTTLQQIWLVVSPHNPLKPTAGLLNEYHRLDLINKALGKEIKIQASNIEFNLPKPSYTIDTLTYLKEKFPQHTFSVIMGSDSFTNITKWKNYEAIIKNYPFYIYKRPGFEINNHLNANITVLDAPLLEISSTHILIKILKRLIASNEIIETSFNKYKVAPNIKPTTTAFIPSNAR